MLVWIDLETTGLDPDVSLILEVACVVTDDQLNEIASFEAVTDGACWTVDRLFDPKALEMHTANGLLHESRTIGDEIELVARDLHDFIAKHAQPGEAQLAGSTVSFDRAFLKWHMPRVDMMLHYRNLDVSSLNEFARRFESFVYDMRPKGDKTHRAMADIRHSIEVCRHYANALGDETIKVQW